MDRHVNESEGDSKENTRHRCECLSFEHEVCTKPVKGHEYERKQVYKLDEAKV